MITWAVVVDHGQGPTEAYVGYWDDPNVAAFDEASAKEYADQINTFHQTSGWATAVPVKLAHPRDF